MPYISDDVFEQLRKNAMQYAEACMTSDSLVEITNAADSLCATALAATSERYENEKEEWRWREGK